jgi:hypothetical protein
MNTLTVRASGQTIVVSITDDGGGVTTRVNGVTFPQTIVTDVSYSLPDGTYTVSCLIGGDECYGKTLSFVGSEQSVIAPVPTEQQLASHDATDSATYVPQAGVSATGAAKDVLVVGYSPAARGKSGVAVGENTFNSDVDPIISFGYNLTGTGTLRKAGENAAAFNVEGYYNDGTANKKMEAYLQFVPASGTGFVRPFFAQYDRTNEKISAVQIAGDGSGGSADGKSLVQFIGQDPASPGSAYNVMDVSSNLLNLYAPTAGSNTKINVQSSTGHSGILQLGYNAVDSVLTMLTTSAQSAAITVGAHTALYLFDAFGLGGAISVGVQDNNAAATFMACNDSILGVVARAHSATQSTSIFEAQNSSGVAQSRFNKIGTLMTKVATAPVLADMVDGEIALYTDGAGALKVAQRISGVLTIKTATLT